MTRPVNHVEPEVPPQAAAPARKKSVIREYAEAILIAILLALLIRIFVVQAFKIPSGSMIPTLLVGDHILVNKFIYRFRDPARGDVVVFKYPVEEHRDFIKRVIGVGGETVYIKDRFVYVNCPPAQGGCEPLRESWAYYEERLVVSSDSVSRFEVPPGSYFVMGDNRNNSQDSRYWGYVKREKIKGQAFIVYWSWDSERDDRYLWQRVRWSRLGRLIY
jgi:signal peptidase I